MRGRGGTGRHGPVGRELLRSQGQNPQLARDASAEQAGAMKNLRWFNLREFERDGRFYERLGIRIFRRFAAKGDYWNRLRRRADPGFRNVSDVHSAIEWEALTRRNEAIHLCSLAVGISILVWLSMHGEYAWLIVVFFAVLVWDVYPIMLQRYTRARIWRIKAMANRRHERDPHVS